MGPSTKVGLASLLATAFGLLCAISAPPSEFAPRTSEWWGLEPLMWPALLGGPALALVALVLGLITVRGAALLCIGAAGLSMVGVSIAWGIGARASLSGLALPLAFLAVPMLAAAEGLRQHQGAQMADHAEAR